MTKKLRDELPQMLITGVHSTPQFSLDGEHITISLIGLHKVRLPLQFRRSALATFVSRLTQAHLTGESIAATRGAPGELPCVDAEKVRAQAPLGEAFVALSVLSHKLMVQHFAISPDQAEALANELREAAESARKNASEPRH